MYDSAEYAASRLNGCLVTRNGNPFLVDSCYRDDQRIRVRGSEFPDFGHAVCCNLLELNLTPPKLGFCRSGIENRYYYLHVRPHRQYKQGIRHNLLYIDERTDPRNFSWEDISRTILGRFSNYEVALDFVENHPNTMKAFSRDFALVNSDNGPVKLLYKFMGVVGDVVNSRPQVFDRFQFIQESLEEVVGNAAA